ncbi:MAG: threonine/serine dehydratase [Cryomorphaceae bacterium]|nr:threonine/serine dehydratase [Cryomorphaceae bacterium]
MAFFCRPFNIQVMTEKPFRTPLIRQPLLSQWMGGDVYLKCENLQQTHSFKARGAYHAVSLLDKTAKEKGVITHSSGNHGQALAWAAKSHGIEAHIVVPENAPPIKIAAIKQQGGIVHFCASGMDEREVKMREIQNLHGQIFIPPYNHEHIIRGQSTCAKEILEEQPRLNAILAPVGGGGLLSGTAWATKTTNPKIQVLGCEPEAADDAARSFKAKKLIHPGNPDTIADGLRTGLGDLTFNYILNYVDDIYTVDENEIVQAWAFAIHRLKMIMEPSCAVPLAVLKKHRSALKGKSIAIIITGGNVDTQTLPNASKALGFM